MTIRSILKLFCMGFLMQLLVLETADAAQYCQSRRTYRRSGRNVRLFYDVNHSGAQALCDMNAGLFERRNTGDRLFHRVSTAPAPSTRPGVQNAAFLGPVRSTPLFNRGGQVTDFVSAYARNSPHRSTRRSNLHAWPEYRVNGQTQLACGSEHIRRQRSRAYMRPTSACMLAGAAQEWRQTVCPNNTPDCQLRFGDMTFGNSRPGHWPHRSHRNGNCVDVWPIRKPGNSGDANVGTQAYDRDRTRQLIRIFQRWGGAKPQDGGNPQIFFDDAVLIREGLTRPLRRTHLDHIHICFPETAASQRHCQQATFDSNICPGIGNGTTGPAMVNDTGASPRTTTL